jgi:hypothetical protein
VTVDGCGQQESIVIERRLFVDVVMLAWIGAAMAASHLS